VTETWAGVAWVAGGYIAGTLPSAYLVARARGGDRVIADAGRRTGETDPHMLLTRDVGGGWSAAAATADVLKALAYALAARFLADLEPAWLAAVGVAVVLGHAWPPYLRDLAGRGLAATAGVYLALLPIEMVVLGLMILAGKYVADTAIANTVGLAAVPAIAAFRGEPWELVAMAGALWVMIMARRLEGVGDVIRGGTPRATAIRNRILHDASEWPRAKG
jgi:glycerol-3-phosphate acyltransferase PlsY